MERVLLLETSTTRRRAMHALLASKGFRVTELPGYSEALPILESLGSGAAGYRAIVIGWPDYHDSHAERIFAYLRSDEYEHVAVLRHKVYRHVPLLSRISDLSVASSGDFYTLDRGGGVEVPPDLPFARTHGAGYRGLYDLTDPEKSRFMITSGQSGHIFSRHYGDLVALWNDVKSITLTGSEEDLKKAGARELIFSP